MCSEKNVWKVGSNWGNNGESILHLFLNYGCAFFGGASDNAKKGDWRKAKKGDLLIITDGKIPIAVGECLSPFSSYEESKIHFCAVSILKTPPPVMVRLLLPILNAPSAWVSVFPVSMVRVRPFAPMVVVSFQVVSVLMVTLLVSVSAEAVKTATE